MLWVRKAYARWLAVAFAWLSALLPWNVSYVPDIGGGSLLFLRFPFFQIRFAVDVPMAGPLVILDPVSAAAFQAGSPLELAYRVWTIGAVIIGFAVVASVYLIVDDKPLEDHRVDPIRLMGALLGLAALVLTGAFVLVYVNGFQGPTVPVGVVLLYAFGLILLLVERVEPAPVTAAA